ncbi:MFS general substrate transporter [Amanita muscaria]
MTETAIASYPCGAFRAWSTVFGSALFIFCELGTLQSFGVYQDYYSREWLSNYTASDISWIGGIQAFFELALGILGGKLFEAGYCRPMLIFASVLFSFSYFMLSLAKQGQYYQVFLSHGLGVGIAMGLFFVPGCTLSLRHFRSEAKQALAVGIVFAGGSLGAVIYAIMLNYLLNSGIGFAWSVRVTALLSTVCLLIANLMITVPPRANISPSGQTPSQKGLLHLPYILICMSGFFAILGCYFPFFLVQVFAVKHGISGKLVFYSLAIINISSVFSRIVVNSCVKKIGVFKPSIISCALNGCATFGMLACYTPTGLVLFSICYGACYGSTFSLYGPLVVQVAPSEDTGKVLGYAWTPSAIAAVIGPSVGAALVGKDYIWWRGVVFAALCFFVATVLQLVAREIHIRHLKRKERESWPEKS